MAAAAAKRDLVHCQTVWCRRILLEIKGPGEYEYRVPAYHRRGSSVVRLRCPDCEQERMWSVDEGPVRDILAELETYRFLASASPKLLLSMPDEDRVLDEIVGIPIPKLADWAVVVLGEIDQPPRRVVAAHVATELRGWVQELYTRYPATMNPNHLLHDVMTRHETLLTQVDAQLLGRITLDSDHRRLYAILAPCSLIAAPLIARGKLLGGLVLNYSPSGRRYTMEDVRLVEDLAFRAALAIDNCALCSTGNP